MGGAYRRRETDQWKKEGVRILVEKDGKWKEKHSFAAEAREAVTRLKPPDFGRQRLYPHPITGKLYVAEDSGFGKSFLQMVEIDPESEKIKLVETPFDAEDICFDNEGMMVTPSASRAKFCVHYNLAWIQPNESIRADVRVYWMRRGANPALYAFYTNCGQAAVNAMGTDNTNVRCYSDWEILQRNGGGGEQ